jgi:hypothetical protein
MNTEDLIKKLSWQIENGWGRPIYSEIIKQLTAAQELRDGLEAMSLEEVTYSHDGGKTFVSVLNSSTLLKNSLNNQRTALIAKYDATIG